MGNKKVGRFSSSDFGGLANQQSNTVLSHKLVAWTETVKPQFRAECSGNTLSLITITVVIHVRKRARFVVAINLRRSHSKPELP